MHKDTIQNQLIFILTCCIKTVITLGPLRSFCSTLTFDFRLQPSLHATVNLYKGGVAVDKGVMFIMVWRGYSSSASSVPVSFPTAIIHTMVHEPLDSSSSANHKLSCKTPRRAWPQILNSIGYMQQLHSGSIFSGSAATDIFFEIIQSHILKDQ